jgi:2-C-methyl-D-erythritol 4-phosphate cytidylyltransferase
MKTSVVIPAGGKGERFGSDVPKQFLELKGKPVIVRTIELFDEIDEIDSIVIAVHSEWFTYTKELIKKYNLTKVKDVVVGGKERQDSIYNALHSKAIEDAEIVIIHDAIRPFLSKETILKVMEMTEENGAVILGLTPNDPVKEINNKNQIIKTIQRGKLTITQTPQSFWKDIIVNAFEKAREVNYVGSDSSQIVEFLGYKVTVMEGSKYNIKLTTPFDMKLAELILNELETGIKK